MRIFNEHTSNLYFLAEQNAKTFAKFNFCSQNDYGTAEVQAQALI